MFWQSLFVFLGWWQVIQMISAVDKDEPLSGHRFYFSLAFSAANNNNFTLRDNKGKLCKPWKNYKCCLYNAFVTKTCNVSNADIFMAATAIPNRIAVWLVWADGLFVWGCFFLIFCNSVCWCKKIAIHLYYSFISTVF